VSILDLDFSAQPNQSLATDGTYTIGGYTAKKENSVNDAVAMSVVAGQGLNIQPSGGAYFSGSRTLPLLFFPLSSLNLAGLDWISAFRIVVELFADNANTNDVVLGGIDNDAMGLSYAVWRGLAPGSRTLGNVITTSSTSTQISGPAIPDLVANSGVFMMDIPNLFRNVPEGMVAYGPTPMPAANGLMGALQPTRSQAVGSLASPVGVISSLGAMGVVVGAERGTVGYNTTVKRLRLDVRF
jgi:hypothetical protein